jgi:hypothetical protein
MATSYLSLIWTIFYLKSCQSQLGQAERADFEGRSRHFLFSDQRTVDSFLWPLRGGQVLDTSGRSRYLEPCRNSNCLGTGLRLRRLLPFDRPHPSQGNFADRFSVLRDQNFKALSRPFGLNLPLRALRGGRRFRRSQRDHHKGPGLLRLSRREHANSCVSDRRDLPGCAPFREFRRRSQSTW